MVFDRVKAGDASDVAPVRVEAEAAAQTGPVGGGAVALRFDAVLNDLDATAGEPAGQRDGDRAVRCSGDGRASVAATAVLGFVRPRANVPAEWLLDAVAAQAERGGLASAALTAADEAALIVAGRKPGLALEQPAEGEETGDADAERMEALERRILKRLGIADPY